MKRILCSVLALGLLAGCAPAATGGMTTAETAETAPTAAPQELSVYYEAGASTAAAQALRRYAEAQGVTLVELPDTADAAEADLAVLNAEPAADDGNWVNMGTDSLLSTAAIRAGVDPEAAVSSVTALPLGKTLYGYWADSRMLAALFQLTDTDSLESDLKEASWAEWTALADAVSGWIAEPAETTVTLNGNEYALSSTEIEPASNLQTVFTLPMSHASVSFGGAAFTGVLLAAGEDRSETTLTGPLNGFYSALELELTHRDTNALPTQAEAAGALQEGEALFYRGTMADLMVHTDGDLQDHLVCLPLKCDFVESDLSTTEYNLTGLMNYPILSTAAWLAIPAGVDEEGLRAAAAAILWLYTSEPGEETLTETLGLITPWGTAANDTTACQMQIEQVGAGILPEVSLTPAQQQALAVAGVELGFDGSNPRTEFARTDRDTWREAVITALASAGDAEE